jgi:hypothetical protein
MPSTTLARGNAISTFYIAPSLTPTSVTNATTSNQTFSVPGLQVNDIIVAQGYIANQTSGIFIAESDCLTAGVLTVQFGNFSAAPATPAAGIYEFQIARPENLPLPTTAV